MNINKTAKIAISVAVMVMGLQGHAQINPGGPGGTNNPPGPGPTPAPVGPWLVDFATDGNAITLTNLRLGSVPEQSDLGEPWVVELFSSSNAVAGPWTVVDLQTYPTLPVKGTLSDTNLGINVNYRASVSPCLVWKTAVGYHFRNGWNGFTPPFNNKYLVRSMRVEWLNVFGGVTNEVYGSPFTLVETADPVTGLQTPPLPITPNDSWPFGGEATFPFGDGTVFTNSNWTITDTHYRLVEDTGPGDPRYIHYTDVWLSQPNTMAATDARAQALVDLSLSNADWGTMTTAWYGDCGPETCVNTGQDVAALYALYSSTPPPVNLCPILPSYPYTPGMSNWVQAPWPVTTNTAAAGSFYIPAHWGNGVFYVDYDAPEMYLKWGSVLRSPTGWTVNWEQFAASYTQPTVSGTSPHPGDCTDTLSIQAPAADVGTNWCITVVPMSGP